MPQSDSELNPIEYHPDETVWPAVKEAHCVWCGVRLRLIRRGRITMSGRPEFWYVEECWVEEGRLSHVCVEVNVWKESQAEPVSEIEIPSQLSLF
jgi:hypothetical protein